MVEVVEKKYLRISFSLLAGLVLGALFTTKPILVIIGYVLVGVVVPAALALMEKKYDYWVFLFVPVIGFATGYFVAIRYY